MPIYDLEHRAQRSLAVSRARRRHRDVRANRRAFAFFAAACVTIAMVLDLYVGILR